MNTDFLWVEEYRPKTIDDCILLTSLKTLFKSFIKKGELSNLLFSGTIGYQQNLQLQKHYVKN